MTKPNSNFNLKVLHVGQMRVAASGIAQQMLEEQRAARSLGISWDSRLFVPRSCGVNEICVESYADFSKKFLFKKSFFNWLHEVERSYDLIVLRHSIYSLEQYFYLRRARRRVFLVHHTLEVPELLSTRGLVGKLLAAGEALLGALSINSACGLISVTPEIGSYEQSRAKVSKPCLVYPNGVLVRNELSIDDLRSYSKPEFLFVASNFVPWHGLDVLIEAMRSCSQEFVVHLVGGLTEEQKNLVSRDSRFVIHGILSPEKISDITAKCWVGLASFALFRKKMKQACTLKVREYLAGGLPVYSGHKDIFPDDFRFYRNGPVDLDLMIDFARECRQVSRKMVSDESRSYIDKESLLHSLYSSLEVFGEEQGRFEL